MSHFYGTVRGGRGEATKTGTKHSGLVTYCASRKGAVRCQAYINEDGEDCVIVDKVPWNGAGESKILYDGPIGEVKE